MPVRRGLHGPQSTASHRQRREAVCGDHTRWGPAGTRRDACEPPPSGARSGVRARGGDRAARAVLRMWETGLDNPVHLKGSITWLSAASTSAGPRVSTPAPPPSSSGPPRPPASP
ncbi:hypothetical protein GTY23_12375 [Streptomyces sp. SID5998]|nr:hypothetical protein [Streptomyces sp. SID5998]